MIWIWNWNRKDNGDRNETKEIPTMIDAIILEKYMHHILRLKNQ